MPQGGALQYHVRAAAMTGARLEALVDEQLTKTIELPDRDRKNDGAAREYPLPDSGARPRRLTNNPDGFIYYSDFARGFIGRLDPRSGKVEEWPSPGGPGSQPYGIASTRDGRVWYSESGVKPNTLVVFEPKTGSTRRWPIPSGGGVVRNMVATPDGRLYLACSGVNKVAVAGTPFASISSLICAPRSFQSSSVLFSLPPFPFSSRPSCSAWSHRLWSNFLYRISKIAVASLDGFTRVRRAEASSEHSWPVSISSPG